MIPISLPYIYELSSALRPIASIKTDDSIESRFYDLLSAQEQLNGFLTESIYSSALKATRAPGMELLEQIKKLTAEEDRTRLLNWFDTYYLNQTLQKFETVLTAEMNIGGAFWVTKKRGYDTLDLINQAEVLFPSELVEKVPEAIVDIRSAGRCLAFELGTACGFHIMRATELVLHTFFDAVTKGAERPKNRTIGDYLRVLDDMKAGDPKVRGTLRQIKDLHRNELMHPEDNLSLDDAIALIGIAQSAIIAMLKEIPAVQLELPATTL